jgi:replicative DNA helicase
MTEEIMFPVRQAAHEAFHAAQEILERDTTGAPTWFTPKFTEAIGPMLPGDVIGVGANSGAGKSTFVLSLLNHLATERRKVVLFGLEMPPEDWFIMWAAAQLKLRSDAVREGRWGELPEGSRDAITSQVEMLRDAAWVHMVPERRVGVQDVWRILGDMVDEFGAPEVVIVDHLHRLYFDPSSNYRVTVTEACRDLKEFAINGQFALVVTSQFNRSSDPMDMLRRPGPERFKESAGLQEESTVTMALTRAIRSDCTMDDRRNVMERMASPTSIAKPRTLAVHCLKHRRRDMANVKTVELKLEDGGLLRDPWYGED